MKTLAFNKLSVRKVSDFLFDHVVEVILILLILVMGNVSKTFNTLPNWLNIFRNMSMKGLIAFGMTMVIISGQIDLSIGSTVALSGVIVARACRDLPDLMGISVTMAGSIMVLSITANQMSLPGNFIRAKPYATRAEEHITPTTLANTMMHVFRSSSRKFICCSASR